MQLFLCHFSHYTYCAYSTFHTYRTCYTRTAADAAPERAGLAWREAAVECAVFHALQQSKQAVAAPRYYLYLLRMIYYRLKSVAVLSTCTGVARRADPLELFRATALAPLPLAKCVPVGVGQGHLWGRCQVDHGHQDGYTGNFTHCRIPTCTCTHTFTHPNPNPNQGVPLVHMASLATIPRSLSL